MRDFTLPATPAIARRLIEVSQIADIAISQEITDLASTGKVPPADFDGCPFPIDAEFQALTQKIVDYDANAIIRFDDTKTKSIINCVLGAVHLLGLPAVIETVRRKNWPVKMSDNVVLSNGAFPVEFLTKERRGGVLVLDGKLIHESICREFQHIIVLQSITLSNYRGQFADTELLSRAVMTLHGMTLFETSARRDRKRCYPYFNIIDLIPSE